MYVLIGVCMSQVISSINNLAPIAYWEPQQTLQIHLLIHKVKEMRIAFGFFAIFLMMASMGKHLLKEKKKLSLSLGWFIICHIYTIWQKALMKIYLILLQLNFGCSILYRYNVCWGRNLRPTNSAAFQVLEVLMWWLVL